MAIRVRGAGVQVDVCVKGVRWRGTATTAQGAEIMEAQVRADLLAGKTPSFAREGTAMPETLGELRNRVIARAWKGTKNEIGAMKSSGAVLAYFGPKIPFADIDTDRVDGLVAYLEGMGNANATINNKLAALSKMLRFAHKRGWLPTLPYIKRKPVGKGRIRFLSDVEEGTMLATVTYFGAQDYADLFVFLIDTGVRLGEAWRVEWQDVTLTAPASVTLWVTKGGDARTVPLTTRSATVLQRRQEAGWPTPFGTLDRNRMRHVWDRVRAHMDMSDDTQFVPHMLRHTCASRLVQRGVPILVVKEWLGHKTITVTMRYAHLAPKNLFDAVAVLERQAA